MEYLWTFHPRDPYLRDYEGNPSYWAEAQGIARAILLIGDTSS